MKQYKINLTCGQDLIIKNKGTTNLISISNINGAEPIEIDVTEYADKSCHFSFKQNNALTQVFGDSYEIKD